MQRHSGGISVKRSRKISLRISLVSQPLTTLLMPAANQKTANNVRKTKCKSIPIKRSGCDPIHRSVQTCANS